jgi:hypothetical protein
MLNRYKFSMVFPPENDLRIAEVATFLDIMREAFGVSDWRTSGDEIFPITTDQVARYLGAKIRKNQSKGVGIMTLIPDEGNYPIMICTSTGSNEYLWDYMEVEFHAADGVPDLFYFARCIEACHPTVAEISHCDNKHALNFAGRSYAQGRLGESRRPVIISWFHYFDNHIAEEFGGMAHCLRTPAYRVELFCEGILIQLTSNPFDPVSDQDLLAQRKAMQHLGLPWEFKKGSLKTKGAELCKNVLAFFLRSNSS